MLPTPEPEKPTLIIEITEVSVGISSSAILGKVFCNI